MRGRENAEREANNTAADAVLSSLATVSQELSTIKLVVTEVHQLLQNQAVVKEWYTTHELAEVMKVSVYTVAERWCNAGRIECAKDPDTGKWRIPGHEYRRLMMGGALKPRSK